MKKLILFTAFLFLLTACGNNFKNISTTELGKIKNDNNDYQYVDVRTSSEYNSGHISGFINIDFYQFQSDRSLLDNLDKDIPVVLICRTGNRSSQAGDILQAEGFKTVYNVTGGITSWKGDLVR